MVKLKSVICIILLIVFVYASADLSSASDAIAFNFFSLFEDHGTIMMLTDGETGDIVFANHAAQLFYGYDKSTLESMNLTDINLLEFEEASLLWENAINGIDNSFSIMHTLSDGIQKTVEVHSYPYKIENKVYLFSVILDQTETLTIQSEKQRLRIMFFVLLVIALSVLTVISLMLLRIVKKLRQSNILYRQSEEKLNLILKNTISVVYRCKENANWTMTYLSEGCLELTGYHAHELIDDHNVSFGDIIIETFKSNLAVRTNPVYEHQYQIMTKDGHVKWVLDKGYTIYDADGAPIAEEGVLTDITSLKALELEKSWLEEGSLLSQLGSFEWSLKDGKIKWSKSMYQIFEIDDIFQDLTYEVVESFFHPEDLPYINSVIHDSMVNKSDYELEYRIVMNNGSTKWLHEIGFFKYDIQNLPYLNVGTAQDITQRKHLELKVKEQVVQIEHAIKEKNNFLSVISHEIRTPLNAIIGFTDVMKRTGLTKNQMNYMMMIESSGDMLRHLIGDILDFNKLESDSLVLENVDFEFETLLLETANQVALNCFSKGLELVVDIDLTLPRQMIGDPYRLKQVLTNLL
ncbi:MAG TPA: hypothetical protein DCS67_09350, partial [Clostridiales bacterium UBA8960]|nr:hypothetical protein [Clostridiales bacterium UBA8960]